MTATMFGVGLLLAVVAWFYYVIALLFYKGVQSTRKETYRANGFLGTPRVNLLQKVFMVGASALWPLTCLVVGTYQTFHYILWALPRRIVNGVELD